MAPHLWLRAETKKNEQRTALTPKVAKTLVDNGFQVTIEELKSSAFNSSEYTKLGLTVVPAGTWRTAPADAYIIGLKELPEGDDTPLTHTHIFFAHCYKQQAGWKDVLSRFKRGNGTLLDLEFLKNDQGRRVAAFGYHAGFAGAALGIDLWTHRILDGDKRFPRVRPFDCELDLLADVAGRLHHAMLRARRFPRIIITGALGRCGSGAVQFCRELTIPEENIIRWDMAETAKGGPFVEIIENDVFVNCIYLSEPIAPFLTLEELSHPDRKLTAVVDVSCDTTNPYNPIPIYNESTSFDTPALVIKHGNAKPLDVVAIDHLPTLLPREASEVFSADLLPSLLQLADRQNARVWTDAEDLFKQKLTEAGL
ncbi:saccharopine dehydrogenase Lys3 [Polychytrium aggregatum]|uniref:saccharopine dehydrogenase Lys3 n=1 Tax=Polychytrium aggregatum TaxID=110093 RepID=UPI0022FF0231|nr:saccharopine dehydrogenase Lys3 [Polychytrium aggregatum]KAI9208989.1 saccharopine dehydrogenase Lys3 [Polychytrium aggregatum]